MVRRLASAVGVLALLAAPGARAEEGALVGFPRSMAAAGDSTTTAALSSRLERNQWENSWATGDNARVQSHYLRILAASPAVEGHVFNAAVSGQRMRHLEAQAQRVVAAQPEYVVVLMGANDVCAQSEAEMPSVETFRAQFEAAMATLAAGLPDARIAVASVPDVSRLWALFRGNPAARFLWSLLGICPTVLANPDSDAPGDVERRARVRQRIQDYNRQLAEVCAQHLHCRFDGEALFRYAFTVRDVSSFDFFHPSEEGQRQIAAVTWGAGFDFGDAVPPVSAAQMEPAEEGIAVVLTATDDVGVAGIEYRDTPTTWRRYDAPLVRQVGETVTFRAVDVNGNVEAAQTLTVVAPVVAAPAGPDAGGGPVPEGEVLPGPEAPVGCGCSGGPVGVGSWAGLAVLWAWWGRRRGPLPQHRSGPRTGRSVPCRASRETLR